MQGVVERHGGYSSSRLGLVGSGVSVSSSLNNFNWIKIPKENGQKHPIFRKDPQVIG